MAGHLANNRELVVDGVDLSSNVKGLSLIVESATVDNTVQGSTFKQNLADTPSATLSGTMTISYGADESWATIAPLVGTEVSCEVLPDTTNAVETTAGENPRFTVTALVTMVGHIAGEPGSVAEVPFSWPVHAISWT